MLDMPDNQYHSTTDPHFETIRPFTDAEVHDAIVELLRDEENSTATSKEKIFIAKPEQVAWPEVERMLRRLRECLDAGGDIRACMHELLPSYHEPQPISAEEATAQARLETKAG